MFVKAWAAYDIFRDSGEDAWGASDSKSSTFADGDNKKKAGFKCG